MLPMSPEVKALIDDYTTALARLMREHTEPEKLKDFESMEVEIRDQMVELIAPKIGKFFFQKEEKNAQGANEK